MNVIFKDKLSFLFNQILFINKIGKNTKIPISENINPPITPKPRENQKLSSSPYIINGIKLIIVERIIMRIGDVFSSITFKYKFNLLSLGK